MPFSQIGVADDLAVDYCADQFLATGRLDSELRHVVVRVKRDEDLLTLRINLDQEISVRIILILAQVDALCRLRRAEEDLISG